jgi:Zn-dependent protease/CBS domain-containing protein
MEGSLRLGRIAGIDVSIHVSWLVVFGLVVWSLAAGYLPALYPGWAPGTYLLTAIVAALLLFASVLAHELSHSIVARARGLPVRGITLFIFGGVANIGREASRPLDEFLMAIVGPLASLFLAALCWGAGALVRPAGPSPAHAILAYLATLNTALAFFNLLPGFPLDGGRVLHAIIWGISADFRRATQVATLAGNVVAYLFILGGLWIAFIRGDFFNGIWLAFIGWFLNNAADASRRQVEIQYRLAGVRVGDIMNPAPLVVERHVTLSELVNDYVLRRGVRALPVVEGDRLVGIITLSDIKDVPQEQWSTTTVGDVVGRRGKLVVATPRQDLASALNALAEGDLNQLPVVEDGRLVGLLTRSDIIRYFQVRELLGLDRLPPRSAAVGPPDAGERQAS